MSDELIDKMSEVVDKFLLENDIGMMIRLPEGSMDPEIKSSFDELGFDKNVITENMVEAVSIIIF